jgi:protein-disulfide isomerase
MRKEITVLLGIASVVILAAVVGAGYYRSSLQNAQQANPTASNRLVHPDSPTLGASDAKVTLVEFLDPECESCAAFAPVVKGFLKDYSPNVRLVVRYLPLHQNSRLAAAYTEAAGEAGKYWEMQDVLFRRQPEWGERHGQPATTATQQIPANVLFERYAAEIGLDAEKLRNAVLSNRFAAKIERDFQDAQRLGIQKTPTFFVNGRQLTRFSREDLKALIEDELKKHQAQ